MGSLKIPGNALAMSDVLVYSDPVNVIIITNIGCNDLWKNSKILLFKFKNKPVLGVWQVECFEFETCSILESVVKKNLSSLLDVNIKGVLQGSFLKTSFGILILSFEQSFDPGLFLSKVFDLNAPLKMGVLGPGCFTFEDMKCSLKLLSNVLRRRQEGGLGLLNLSVPLRGYPGGHLVQTPRSLLFAVLGWSGNNATVTIEAYDPSDQKWFYVAQDGFIKRAYHGVVMLGILIYVIGGFDGGRVFNSVFCFDVVSRQWYRRASLHVPRCYVTGLSLRGMVYALGGFDGDERFRSCERFDPINRRWTYISSMHDRRSDASGAEHKGKIFMCGGFNGSYVLRSTEIYDPDQDQWTLVANTISPRSGHVLASYKSVLMLLGGYDGEERLRTVERYDDADDKWHPHASMLNPRSNFAAAILDDKLHVIAGYNGIQTFANVERYDDVSKVWQLARSLNKHRSAHGACVFKDSMTVSMCTVSDHITVQSANVE